MLDDSPMTPVNTPLRAAIPKEDIYSSTSEYTEQNTIIKMNFEHGT